MFNLKILALSSVLLASQIQVDKPQNQPPSHDKKQKYQINRSSIDQPDQNNIGLKPRTVSTYQEKNNQISQIAQNSQEKIQRLADVVLNYQKDRIDKLSHTILLIKNKIRSRLDPESDFDAFQPMFLTSEFDNDRLAQKPASENIDDALLPQKHSMIAGILTTGSAVITSVATNPGRAIDIIEAASGPIGAVAYAGATIYKFLKNRKNNKINQNNYQESSQPLQYEAGKPVGDMGDLAFLENDLNRPSDYKTEDQQFAETARQKVITDNQKSSEIKHNNQIADFKKEAERLEKNSSKIETSLAKKGIGSYEKELKDNSPFQPMLKADGQPIRNEKGEYLGTDNKLYKYDDNNKKVISTDINGSRCIRNIAQSDTPQTPTPTKISSSSLVENSVDIFPVNSALAEPIKIPAPDVSTPDFASQLKEPAGIKIERVEFPLKPIPVQGDKNLGQKTNTHQEYIDSKSAFNPQKGTFDHIKSDRTYTHENFVGKNISEAPQIFSQSTKIPAGQSITLEKTGSVLGNKIDACREYNIKDIGLSKQVEINISKTTTSSIPKQNAFVDTSSDFNTQSSPIEVNTFADSLAEGAATAGEIGVGTGAAGITTVTGVNRFKNASPAEKKFLNKAAKIVVEKLKGVAPYVPYVGGALVVVGVLYVGYKGYQYYNKPVETTIPEAPQASDPTDVPSAPQASALTDPLSSSSLAMSADVPPVNSIPQGCGDWQDVDNGPRILDHPMPELLPTHTGGCGGGQNIDNGPRILVHPMPEPLPTHIGGMDATSQERPVIFHSKESTGRETAPIGRPTTWIDKNGVARPVSDLINLDFELNENNKKHIFDDREGHLIDTPENRELIMDLVKDVKNFLLQDERHGKLWFAKTLPNGKQIWAEAIDNVIRNCGINDIPREANSETGLAQQNRPVR